MTQDWLIGRKLASYRVEKFLGQGGMAQVYYAWDESLDRPAAVKVISPAFRDNISYAERFIQEAKAISQWRHENILQVYYAGKDQDVYFYAMEYIDGQNLEQILQNYSVKGELMPHDDVIRIGRAVAGALDYAHNKHVIHRDIKPSNVMIDRENRVVLTDFGLAMDTQKGSLGQTFGTPHYVAPEQARNSADAVPQSDLYSLGIIMYEMLTGVVPFDDPSSMSLALKHLTEPPPPPRNINPALSEQVEQVLLRALEKEPQKRFPKGVDLLNNLADALRAQSAAGGNILALPPSPHGVQPRPLSRVSVIDNIRLSAPMKPPGGFPPVPPKPAAVPPPSAPPPAGSVKTAPPPSATPSRPAATTQPPPANSPMQLLGLGAVGTVIFLILIVGAFSVFGGGGDETADSTPSATGTTLAEVTETAAPTAPSATDEPDAEPSPTSAAAVAMTEPAAVEPTPTTAPVVEQPTEAPVVPTSPPAVEPTAPPVAAVPTILYPNGKKMTLFYNGSSFYLYNNTQERIKIRSFSFEALDGNGNPVPFGVGGDKLAFFPNLEREGCIEIKTFGTDIPQLRPGQCKRYNAEVSFQITSSEIFWITRPEATQFRILWDGQEVGRCPLADNTCEVFIP